MPFNPICLEPDLNSGTGVRAWAAALAAEFFEGDGNTPLSTRVAHCLAETRQGIIIKTRTAHSKIAKIIE